MTRRDLFLLPVVLMVLGIAGYRIRQEWIDLAPTRPVIVHYAESASSRASARAFAIQLGMLKFYQDATAAEAIDDPLRRCLAFPDPPGSHWSHAGVNAYCHYLNQSAIAPQDAANLIAAGHADQLDGRLADALRLQLSKPGPRGLLDRTYDRDFASAAGDTRKTIDAWKRQSPHSAFALAASGAAYVEAAAEARGGDWADKTPQQQFTAMRRMLVLARTDLNKALALDPRLTPAYQSLLIASSLDGSFAQALDLARRGLAIDPSSFGIYEALLQDARPRWGGSIEAMRKVVSQAQQQAGENPVLPLLLPEIAAEPADFRNCACHSSSQLDNIRTVLDQAATSQLLSDAGNGTLPSEDQRGLSGEQLNASIIYLAEALRFVPERVNDRLRLIDELNEHGEPPFALAEADRAVANSPRSVEAFEARAETKETMRDFAGAEQDYRSALSLKPNDVDDLYILGNLYAQSRHQWDEAWSVAEQLVREHPDRCYGWVLRANVQESQPRAGLHETLQYLVQHFSDDPSAGPALARARAALGMDYAKSVQ